MFNVEDFQINFGGLASATVERAGIADVAPLPCGFHAPACRDSFDPGGVFEVECYGPDGALKWADTAKNGVTSVGLDYVVNVAFRGVTAITTWYIGLVDNAGWTGYNSTDTVASHASPNAWVENIQYSGGVRKTWSPGAPSGNAIVNGTTVDFAMTPGSTATIRGLFLVSDNTLGGTSVGTLFSTATFAGGSQAVNSGDTLKVTYTVSAANAAGNS